MIGRRHASLVLAALAALAGPSGSALASAIAAGSTPVTQVYAQIIPAGSVYAPLDSAASPLTVLPGSSGFDVNNLTVKLGDNAQGQNIALGLTFDSKGFAPGGVMNFALNLPPGFTGSPPTLTLLDPKTDLPPSGLTLTSFDPPKMTPATAYYQLVNTAVVPSIVTTPVPEPVSMALWSVAAGLGLLRARAFRRARRIEG